MARYNLIISMKKFFKKLLALFFKKKNQAPESEADSRQETQDTDAVKTGDDAGDRQSQAPDQQQTPDQQPQTPGQQPQLFEACNVADEAQQTAEELQIKLDAANHRLQEKEGVIATVSALLGVQVVDETDELAVLKIAIEDLQNASTNQVEDAVEVLQLLKEHMTNKVKPKNEYLCDKFENALKERKGESVTNILIAFINSIKGRVTSAESSTSQASSSLEISDEQIRAGVNTTKLNQFLIGILKEAGIEVAANKGREAIIEVLKALREESDSASKQQAELKQIKTEKEQLKQQYEQLAKRDNDTTIIRKAIEAGKLPQEAVEELVQQINRNVGDNGRTIGECTSFGEVLKQIAALAADAQLPKDVQEACDAADKKARAQVNDTIRKALDISEVELTTEGIKAAVTKFMCESLSVNGDNLDQVINLIIEHINQSEAAKKVKNDLGVKSLTVNAISKQAIAKELERLKDAIKSDIVAKASSIESAINQLLKKIKESYEEAQKLAKQLVELITKYDGEFKADDKAKVIDLLLTYSGKVNAKEQQLDSEIKAKAAEIQRHLGTISARESDITKLKEQQQKLEAEKNELLSESDKMVEFAQACADEIYQRSQITLVDDCDASGQSETLQQTAQGALEKLLDKVRNVKAAETPVDTRAAFRQVFVEDINDKYGAINVISQYYAYSRLPFMTDSARKYGVYFNRKNMAQLFDAVNDLLIAFGIRLDIPTLFAQSATEGNYAVVNGEEYSELDNFCPQVRNHVDKIDSESKPAQIIYDMVQVGFSVDGRSASKSKVLTN